MECVSANIAEMLMFIGGFGENSHDLLGREITEVAQTFAFPQKLFLNQKKTRNLQMKFDEEPMSF
jgi:hypothetical protein